MTDEITLLLLGPPEVRLGARRLDLGPKRLAILAYVALEGTTSRRQLAALLWPDSEDPLNNLAVARYALTRALSGEALLVDAQSIAPGPKLICDVQRWRMGLEYRDDQAWPLYRGPFLDGFRMSEWADGYGEEFEAWLYETRERLAAERRGFALDLALDRLARNAPAEALPYLETAHDGPEPREDATRWLILALGALGHRDRAALVFAELTRALREELQVEPGDETRSALEAARRGQDEARRVLEAGLVTRRSPSPSREVPYVGQDGALSHVGGWLEGAEGAPVRTVVVLGEPGRGKTRFAEALVERLEASRHLIFKVAGRPTHLPLSALEEGVKTFLETHPDATSHLPDAWRDALARWLPDSLVTDSPPSAPDLERAALMQAIFGLLVRRHHRVVVWLEDLHWIDPASLELVQRLAQHPPELGVMVVATLRDTESPSADLVATLELLRRRGAVLDWPLAPLDEPAVAHLMTAFGRTDLASSMLLRRSGGNPLYLLELLRAAPETSDAHLSALILARLAPLAAPHRQVLEALALLEEAVSVGVLQQVSGRSANETADALEALEASGLIRNAEDGVRFGHEITREVVFGSLNLARRSLLHLRAARARRETPLLAAQHYWTVRPIWEDTDVTAAQQTLLEAGIALALRGEPDGALIWFERALEVAKTPSVRVDVFVACARALERYARFDEANRWLERAELLLEAVEPIRAAAVLNARSDLLIDRFGDADGGARAARDALERLSGVHVFEAQRERARALHLEGWCGFLSNDYGNAERRFRQVVALNEAIGNRADLASNLAALGVTLVFAGRPGAREILDEAIGLARTVGHQSALAYALSSLGMLERREGRFDEAIACFEAAIETRAVLGEGFVMGSWLTGLGNVYFDLGRFSQGRAAHLRALEAPDAGGNARLRATILGNLAETDLRLGQFEEAKRVLKEAIILSTNIPLPALEADLRWWFGEMHTLTGDRTAAEQDYQRAVELAAQTGYTSRVVTGLNRLARLKCDPELAHRALALVNDLDGRTALAFTEGRFTEAQRGLEARGDAYEQLRLALDQGDSQGDVQMRQAALMRLPL